MTTSWFIWPRGTSIEIEGPELCKLIQHDQVIAPFREVESLCRFIQQDTVPDHDE